MRAEDFDTATIKELQERANKCFELAQSPLDEPPHYLDDAGKLRLLLEAQFYLAAVVRKRDEKVARRDFWMEVAIIVLIGLELFEGYQQGKLLDKMDTSTAATATAMGIAKDSLKTLADDQAKSLDRLKEMNDSLQASQKTTGAMASSTGKQLKILQQEQADRLTRQAKKPKLVAYAGGAPIGIPDTPITVREQSDTTIVLDFMLANEGDAQATAVTFRVGVFANDVSVQSSEAIRELPAPRGSAGRGFVTHIDFIRPKANTRMILTFTFPKGQPPFQVLFNVDANELETGTPLGTLNLVPQKPTT